MRRKSSILAQLLGQELQYSLLMISILVAAIALKLLSAKEADNELGDTLDRLERVVGRNDELEEQVKSLDAERAALAQALAQAREELSRKPPDQPPIIFLSEADGFSFASGSSEISPAFAEKLRVEVAPRLVELTRAYSADVIEVIGHTDGVPLGASRAEANLDARLPTALGGQTRAELRPFDNVGLGMTRAIAVARLLESGELPPALRVLPLSAGSLIARGDLLQPADAEKGDAERRRIEIRLRRSKN